MYAWFQYLVQIKPSIKYEQGAQGPTATLWYNITCLYPSFLLPKNIIDIILDIQHDSYTHSLYYYVLNKQTPSIGRIIRKIIKLNEQVEIIEIKLTCLTIYTYKTRHISSWHLTIFITTPFMDFFLT